MVRVSQFEKPLYSVNIPLVIALYLIFDDDDGNSVLYFRVYVVYYYYYSLFSLCRMFTLIQTSRVSGKYSVAAIL